ncbi:MAG: 4-(cytidine 5'-diphospho)-2-C-methyl-D-erythritol kinase [Lachnospiraceae bacterium]|jgi:4-diphosphocytidyl-2-C-methyl-D-erythritol kinase|nr:4-(cytidine 5'-diphospho)-2-C-methyl-D-erythritol kinase [Lachnospiraceae bacterium]
MNSLTTKAYAKINLGLDVLRKREDGYHDLCMIMQTIDLYDVVTLEKTPLDKILVRTNLSYLPTDRRNLVYKAAQAFMERFSISSGIKITLEKNIPVAAGLAGGSADAAATLCLLNEMFQTGLTREELMHLGVTLGADVPYCILTGTALSEGIGEILTPLKRMPDCTILLVKPDISVSTRYVYGNLKLTPHIHHPDITAMKKAIETGSLKGLTSHMDNILQTVTVPRYPVIKEIKHQMKKLGAMTALMSGSGPTVFGIYKNPLTAEKACEYFRRNDPEKQVFLTKPSWPDR